MEKAYKKILARYRNKMLPLNHVVGVGYGKKMKHNRKTDEDSIVILVDKKIPEDQLDIKDLVPGKLGPLKTDVQEVGTLELLSTPRNQRYRPAPGGVSIGHYRISAGTLGGIVKDKKTGEPLILSNNHVLANITNGRDGRAKKGDPILQPGTYDKGMENEDVIGYLERYIPLKPAKSVFNPAYNIVDCAVAKPVNQDAIEDNILGIGTIKGIKDPEIDMKVMKSGRTTGVTEGTIRAIDSTVNVNIDDSKQAVFTDQIVTSPLSQGGDSGSLVLDEDRNAVGLLFAGSNQATVCNKIKNVMNRLDVDFFIEETDEEQEKPTKEPKQDNKDNIRERDNKKRRKRESKRKDRRKNKVDEQKKSLTLFSPLFLLLIIFLIFLHDI
ncbi:MAG: hypothetical protein ACOC2J_00970 [bacterium]